MSTSRCVVAAGSVPSRCIALWDGRSKGTEDMISRAVAHGVTVDILPLRAR